MVRDGGFTVTEPVQIRTSDVDVARLAISVHFHRHFLDPLAPFDRLDASFDLIHLGPMTLGDLRYGADVRLRFGKLGAYHIVVPLSGEVNCRQDGRRCRSNAGYAAVFQPGGDTVIDRCSADCRLIALKIESAALENQLTVLSGRPVRTPLRLGIGLDVERGRGRTWARLVRLLGEEVASPDGLIFQPLVASRFYDGVLTGLLFCADHQYRDALEQQGPQRSPRSVKLAVDAMQTHPDHPHTTGDLAELSGVSARSLQAAFQRHVGTSPMAYLRWVRLGRVHDELRQGERPVAVADVAHRWGFTHLGRFAAAYRSRYGIPPSQTPRIS